MKENKNIQPELKPCPFCGANNLEIGVHHSGIGFIVQCWDCYASGGNSENAAMAIQHWNMRVQTEEKRVTKDDSLKSPHDTIAYSQNITNDSNGNLIQSDSPPHPSHYISNLSVMK